MQFPIQLGLSAFTGADETTFLELFKRLQGTGGYSEQDDSARIGELKAWAYVAAVASGAIDRAAAQIWPEYATELLDEWERTMRLRNSAARNDTERKLRIEAVHRASPRKADIEAALAHMGISTATFLTNVRTDIYHGSGSYPVSVYPNEAIFQSAVVLSDADYDDAAKREGTLDVLEKVLPARAVGHMDDPKVDACVASSLGCNLQTGVLDRSVLWHDGGSMPLGHDNVRAPSRVKNFGPLSKLRAADLNRIQEAMLFDVASDTETMGSAVIGGEWLAVSANLALGNKTIDSSVDWRDRMIFFTGRVSTTDLRIGGGDSIINNTATRVSAMFYSGPGKATGSGTEWSGILNASPALHMWVNTTGDLRVYDGNGATLQYLVGMLFATPDLGEV